MGDKALVIFTNKNEVSPVCYLHWHGDAVPQLLKETKELMETRRGDIEYGAARFLGIVHSKMPNDNLSLGVWNAQADLQNAVRNSFSDQPDFKATAIEELVEYSHGDAGVIIVDVSDYSWKAYGGYLSDYNKEQAA